VIPGSLIAVGIPGPLGVAIFLAVKFGGYILAGLALKKIQPAITAGALKIATVRTVSGLILAPLFVLVYELVTDHKNSQGQFDTIPPYVAYIFLGVLRIFLWALLIYFFTRQTKLSAGKLWMLAGAGAAWSCLLDIPGVLLTVISPGSTPIC
jgi:hypothetical protein